MTSEHDVESALVVGPADTRAGIRGLASDGFRIEIKSMQWERIQFSGGLLPRTLEMGDLFEPQAVRSLRTDIRARGIPDGCAERMEQQKGNHDHEHTSQCRNAVKGPAIRCRRHQSPSDEGGGPKRPETGSPDKDNLLKRMRKVDRNRLSGIGNGREVKR